MNHQHEHHNASRTFTLTAAACIQSSDVQKHFFSVWKWEWERERVRDKGEKNKHLLTWLVFVPQFNMLYTMTGHTMRLLTW